MPETSILIRTFNEERHIGNLLRALRQQTYRDYEIIVVDSGSIDGTVSIANQLADKVISIPSHDFTFGYSLNIGCQESSGAYIIIVSAHTLPLDNEWLSNLIKPFAEKDIAMVFGRQIGSEHNTFSERRDLTRLFGTHTAPYPHNANSAIRKTVWQQHPFDEYLLGLEDIEWAKYAEQKGLRVVYKPEAAIYHIHHEKQPQVFNRYRREAIAAARLGLPHPPQFSPGFSCFYRHLAGDLLATLAHGITRARLSEIFNFRYQQWKGTRQGWFRDRRTDLGPASYELYFPATNKAVQITAAGSADLTHLSYPEVKPSEVLIQVAYCGICATDLEVYNGTLGYYESGKAKYPIVPGHEFSGTIAKVGANSRHSFQLGDRVTGRCIISCENCSSCAANNPTLCPERYETGVMNHDGAYSKYVVLPAHAVHAVPDKIALETACLTEPLAVVLHAIDKIPPQYNPPTECAVLGAGPIGNLCAQVLTQKGYAVTVFDNNKDRLVVLDGLVSGTSPQIRDLDKFSVIIEATGSAHALKSALAESKTGATIVLLGVHYGETGYAFEDIVSDEKIIIGSLGATEQDFKKSLELLPALETNALTSVIMPLEQFQAAWKLHQSRRHLKILLKPS